MITPAYAQAATPGINDMIGTFAPFLLILIIILLIVLL